MATVTNFTQAYAIASTSTVNADFYSAQSLRNTATGQFTGPGFPASNSVYLDVTNDYTGTAGDNNLFTSYAPFVPGSASDPNAAASNAANLAQQGFFFARYSGTFNDAYTGQTSLLRVIGYNTTTPTGDSSIPVGSIILLEDYNYGVTRTGTLLYTPTAGFSLIDIGTTSLLQLDTDQNNPGVTLTFGPFAAPEPSAAFLLPVLATAVLAAKLVRGRTAR